MSETPEKKSVGNSVWKLIITLAGAAGVCVLGILSSHLFGIDLGMVRRSQWIAAVILLSVGGFVGFSISQQWSVTSVRKIAKQTKTLLDTFQKNANDILAIFRREVRDQYGILLEPRQYQTFIKDAEQDYFHARNKHCIEIRLFGTIIGFSFLLPATLADHICENIAPLPVGVKPGEDRVPTVLKAKILSWPLAENDDDFYWRSRFLVSRIFRKIWRECPRSRKILEEGGALVQMELRFSPVRDPTAFLEMGGQTLAVLQTLDASSFKSMIQAASNPQSGDRLHRGFLYVNNGGSAESFAQCKSALDAMWDRSKPLKETWTLHGAKGLHNLTVVSSQALYDMRQSDSSTLATFAGRTVAGERLEITGTSQIRNFLDNSEIHIPEYDKQLADLVDFFKGDGISVSAELDKQHFCPS